jgi:hypothetical protein
VVKVYEPIPPEIWRDGRMYEFAQDYVRRDPSQARGAHPLKAIFDVIKNMVEEQTNPVASGEPMVRLATSVLLTLLAPYNAVSLSIWERLARLGVPMDHNFPKHSSIFSYLDKTSSRKDLWPLLAANLEVMKT